MRPSKKNLVFALITIGLWEEVGVLVVKKESWKGTNIRNKLKSETIQLSTKNEPQDVLVRKIEAKTFILKTVPDLSAFRENRLKKLDPSFSGFLPLSSIRVGYIVSVKELVKNRDDTPWKWFQVQ